MTAPALYAVLWDYGQLIEALDARRIELGLSHDEWNERAGLAIGFTSKACGPGQTAKFGHLSLFKAVRQLGLRIVLEVDDRATKTILDGRVPRQNMQARPNHYSKQPSKRHYRRVRAEMGKRGGIQAAANMTPEQRSERARNAVLVRWSDVKRAANDAAGNTDKNGATIEIVSHVTNNPEAMRRAPTKSVASREHGHKKRTAAQRPSPQSV